jgi:hypothetical protein
MPSLDREQAAMALAIAGETPAACAVSALENSTFF